MELARHADVGTERPKNKGVEGGCKTSGDEDQKLFRLDPIGSGFSCRKRPR